LNRFGVTRECDRQTDERIGRWTDILIANAALNYVTRHSYLVQWRFEVLANVYFCRLADTILFL